MNMETYNVDDILRSLDDAPVVSPQDSDNLSEPMPTPVQECIDSSFSEQDIDNILEENGFSNSGEEEDIDDTDTYERQSEEYNVESETESLQSAIEEHLDNNYQSETVGEAPLEGENNEENINEATVGNGLPLNSPTLLVNAATTRFSGAEWFSEIQKTRIIIGGCGGIGSNLAFQLARMVPANITIYDDDNVEMVNMAGQLFSFDDLGKSKVNAITDMITFYTSMRQVNAIKEKFSRSTEPGDIMLCGFDNMTARKVFFESWKRHLEGMNDGEKGKCLFMDGRLSIDTLQILCIKGNDTYNIDRYNREFLFSDSEAEATVCSMKQTTYLACMIGSLMTNLFTNFIAGTLNPIIPYDLPFFTEYDAQNMIFKTEN